MIRVDCEQGSMIWAEYRRGIPTASEFSRIITPTGKLSAQRERYKAELLAAWALDMDVRDFEGNEWTERGHQLEPQALKYYNFLTDNEATKQGFVYRDEQRMCGTSPDFMVGDNPGELKCPLPHTHLIWWIEGICPREHYIQCQGHIWVCGADYCEFMSYCPELPQLYVRVMPDERIQDALSEHMPTFIGEILNGRDMLREAGVTSEVTNNEAEANE